MRYTIRELRVLSVREQEASETQDILRFRHWKEPTSQTMSWLYYRTLASAVQSSHTGSLGRNPGFAKTVATQYPDETASESEPDDDDSSKIWNRKKLPNSISPEEEDALWGESKLRSRAVDELLGDWTTMDKNQIHENAMSAASSKLLSFQGSFDGTIKATLKQMKTHMDLALLNGCLVQSSGDITNDVGDIVGKLVKGDAYRLCKMKATCDDEGNIWSGRKRVGKAITVARAGTESMATNVNRPPAPDASEAIPPPPYVDAVSENEGKESGTCEHSVQGAKSGEIWKSDTHGQSTSWSLGRVKAEIAEIPKSIVEDKLLSSRDIAGDGRNITSSENETIGNTRSTTSSLSTLKGLPVLADGKVEDLMGNVVGQLVEDDMVHAKKCFRMMYLCDEQGMIRNSKGKVIARVEIIDSAKDEGLRCDARKDGLKGTECNEGETAEAQLETPLRNDKPAAPEFEGVIETDKPVGPELKVPSKGGDPEMLDPSDMSVLEGLKLELDDKMLDLNGVHVGELVDGDVALICRKQYRCTRTGEFRNKKLNVVDRARISADTSGQTKEHPGLSTPAVPGPQGTINDETSEPQADSKPPNAPLVEDDEWAPPRKGKKGKKGSGKTEVIGSMAKENLLPLTVLDNLCIERDGTILNHEGIVVGIVIEGDAKNFASMMYFCDAQGNVLNYAGKIVGKVETVASTFQAGPGNNCSEPLVSKKPEANEKVETKRDRDDSGDTSTTPKKKSSRPFPNFRGLMIDRFGEVLDADGVVVARLVDGDANALCRSGAMCDAEGRIWIGDEQVKDSTIEMVEDEESTMLMVGNTTTAPNLSDQDGVEENSPEQMRFTAWEELEKEVQTNNVNGTTSKTVTEILAEDTLDTKEKEEKRSNLLKSTTAKTSKAKKLLPPMDMNATNDINRAEPDLSGSKKSVSFRKSQNTRKEPTSATRKPALYPSSNFSMRSVSEYSGFDQVIHESEPENGYSGRENDVPEIRNYETQIAAIVEAELRRRHLLPSQSNVPGELPVRVAEAEAYERRKQQQKRKALKLQQGMSSPATSTSSTSRGRSDRLNIEASDRSSRLDPHRLYDGPLLSRDTNAFNPYYAVMPYQTSGVYPPMSNYYGHHYHPQPSVSNPALSRVPEPEDDRVAPLQAELRKLQQQIAQQEITSASVKLKADFESEIKAMEEEVQDKRRAETLENFQGHILEQNLRTLQLEKRLLAAQEAADTCARSLTELERKTRAEMEQQQQALRIAQEEAKRLSSMAVEAEQTAASKHEEAMKLAQQEAEQSARVFTEHQENLAKHQEKLDAEVQARKTAEDARKEMENQMRQLRDAQRQDTPHWTETYYAPAQTISPTPAYFEEDQSSIASGQDSVRAITDTVTETTETTPPTRSGIVRVTKADLKADPSQMIIFPRRMGWKEYEYKTLTKSMLRFGFRPLVEEGAETPCVPSQFYERPGTGGCTLRGTALWHPPGPSLASDLYTSFLKSGWKPGYVRSNGKLLSMCLFRQQHTNHGKR